MKCIAILIDCIHNCRLVCHNFHNFGRTCTLKVVVCRTPHMDNHNSISILGKLHNQTREVLVGTADDDTIYPGGGWDIVEGGKGVDTVVIIGRSSQFKLVLENGVTYIDALSGASAMTARAQLVNVEFVPQLTTSIHFNLSGEPYKL